MNFKKTIITATTTVAYFYECPCCAEGRLSYSHRDDIRISTWRQACKTCGAVIEAKKDSTNPNNLTVRDTGEVEKDLDTLVLLRYTGSTESATLHIVVQSKWYTHSQDSELGAGDAYYYDEHTCPWNYLRVPALFNTDTDRHGLFEHVTTILVPDMNRALTIDSDFDLEINDDTQWLEWVNDLSYPQWVELFFPSHTNLPSLLCAPNR